MANPTSTRTATSTRVHRRDRSLPTHELTPDARGLRRAELGVCPRATSCVGSMTIRVAKPAVGACDASGVEGVEGG